MNEAVLFIYYTPDNYETGCYNLDCPSFIQVDERVYLGAPFDAYSIGGGEQRYFYLGCLRDPDTGNWWLFYKGSEGWIKFGYYAKELYGDGQLSSQAEILTFGGETANNPDLGEMGSGAYANEGFLFAAFQDECNYFDLDVPRFYKANLTLRQDYPELYTVERFEGEIVGEGGDSLFFGGPGED